MSRAAWVLLLCAPGGFVVAPIIWVALRLRARRRVRYVGEPLRTVDLTGMRRSPVAPEDRS
jgi:hypothetical protein